MQIFEKPTGISKALQMTGFPFTFVDLITNIGDGFAAADTTTILVVVVVQQIHRSKQS